MILVGWCVAILLAAGGLGAVLWRRPLLADRAFGVGIGLAAMVGVVPAIRVLAGGTIPDASIRAATPGGPWVFGLDTLSALFLLLVLTAGTAATVYGVRYLTHGYSPRAVRSSHAFVSALLASLVVLVTARAVVPFLIAWEAMALTSYAAIILDHRRADVRRAGTLYLVATHIGILALFALFAVWAPGLHDLSFAALATHPPIAFARTIILLLALLAFGMKAGVVPFHFWLPEAHAAGPSHVSALMSGVVIKVGIYGLMRTGLLLGMLPAWWGWSLLILGMASGVLGVLWALAQHDLKRLLAFHSVENVGIILMGLGAGTLGLAYGHPLVAVLGFAGAALHTLNHALFKSLLFLGAGNVGLATGTRDLDHLGGLARRMPVTATTFLVGAAAIVGLPPLNGFVGEWLVFRSLFAAGLTSDGVRVAILGAGVLGMIGALALACFAKVFGVVFLGEPRSRLPEGVGEAPLGLTAPLVALGAACVAIGTVPVMALEPVLRVAGALGGTPIVAVWPGGVDAAGGALTWFTLGAALLLAAAWMIAVFVRRAHAGNVDDTWSCGYEATTPRMQYTAASFAAPLLAGCRSVAGVRVHRTAETLETEAVDPMLRGVVVPAWREVERVTASVRRSYSGRAWTSLVYVLAALMASLAYLMFAGSIR